MRIEVPTNFSLEPQLSLVGVGGGLVRDVLQLFFEQKADDSASAAVVLSSLANSVPVIPTVPPVPDVLTTNFSWDTLADVWAHYVSGTDGLSTDGRRLFLARPTAAPAPARHSRRRTSAAGHNARIDAQGVFLTGRGELREIPHENRRIGDRVWERHFAAIFASELGLS